MLRGLLPVCLLVGILVFAASSLREKKPAPAALPSSPDANHQVSAACETAIRQQARGPFRVIAFRSALVAEERGGYVISGSVETQSAAGDLQRKKYLCRFHRDALGGLVLDERTMY
jgi:hypothetical protein